MVAREFLRLMPVSSEWRFDVLSVYYDSGHRRPSFELFQNAFSVSYNRKILRVQVSRPLLKGFSTCLN